MYTVQVLSLLNEAKQRAKILFLGVNGASNSSTACTLQGLLSLLVKLRPQASVGETRFRKVVKDG